MDPRLVNASQFSGMQRSAVCGPQVSKCLTVFWDAKECCLWTPGYTIGRWYHADLIKQCHGKSRKQGVEGCQQVGSTSTTSNPPFQCYHDYHTPTDLKFSDY